MDENGEIAKLGSPPDLSPWESTVYAGFQEIGRDFNGSPLMSEKRAWLDEHGYTDGDDRTEILSYWREMEAEDGAVREEARKRNEAKRAK